MSGGERESRSTGEDSANNKLYVGRLSTTASKRDLEDLFGKYGKVMVTVCSSCVSSIFFLSSVIYFVTFTHYHSYALFVSFLAIHEFPSLL
jgi:RNA recognition motif-containing protein